MIHSRDQDPRSATRALSQAAISRASLQTIRTLVELRIRRVLTSTCKLIWKSPRLIRQIQSSRETILLTQLTSQTTDPITPARRSPTQRQRAQRSCLRPSQPARDGQSQILVSATPVM